MTYEECEMLVEAYESAVLLSTSADLKDEDSKEAKTIRDSLGEFMTSILYRSFDRRREA